MVLDWLVERFESAPELPAFVHDDRAVSYGELCASITEFGQFLVEEGIRPGERVAVMGDYSPEAFALLIALARNRNVAIPLSPESVVEVETALQISGCEWRFDFMPGLSLPTIHPYLVTSDSEMMRSFRQSGDPGMVFFSSGSTGTPKGILHNVERVARKFFVQRDPVVAIPFLMFDHFGGFNTVLAITSALGTVVGVSDRSVDSVCSAIERHQVTLLPTTPSFLTLLLAARAQDAYDLSSLRRITYGTEVMPQRTLDRIHEAIPNAALQQTYGLSEVGVLNSKSKGDGSLWVRLGGSGFETKVVDGVLWIRSEYSMVGYINASAAFDEEGWFNTQDQVEVEGEYFRILGRTSDLINVGGQKVYPAEVEDVIMEMANVVDVAVYAEQSPFLGQLVVALIQLANPENAADLKIRVRAHCREKLAAYKLPARVAIAQGPLYTLRHKKSRRPKSAVTDE